MAATLSTRRRAVAVFAGGFCGTIMRYGLSGLIQAWLGRSWPYNILLINVTGALVLAFVTTLADATFLVGPTRRLFINVGLLGAYTTFSSLALGDVLLFAQGQWLPALLYLLLSMVGGLLAVLTGDWLGQRCLKWWRRSPSQAKITRRLSGALPGDLTGSEHIDVQDDVLLPDLLREPETRGPRS
ncbi:MAG: CrcB family protein [Ktedonobacteraceae bacterium]|nr:CrcB family protein [Chloroflexota bacterium]